MAHSDVRSKTTDIRSDTLREQVMVVVFDTIREVTTITVRENEAGDTLRATTVTDRTRASTRDRYHDVQEKVLVRTDTVYVERDSLVVKAIAPLGGDEGSSGRNGKREGLIAGLTRNLKWIFFTIMAIIVLIITIKTFKF